MQSLTEIRALLAARGVRPKHRLGQNFLHDHNVLRKLVDAAEVRAGEVILEVGPGTGALTEVLLERGARVIASEIDREMIEILRERVLPRADGRLTIVEGDCLDGKRALAPGLRAELANSTWGQPPLSRTLAPNSLPPQILEPNESSPAQGNIRDHGGCARLRNVRDHGGCPQLPQVRSGFRLVSNLPYSSATALIVTLLCDHPECTGIFATIQKEVADRLYAAARSDAYGPVSVLLGLLAPCERATKIMDVSPACFWPAPDVTSAVVALRPFALSERPEPLRASAAAQEFMRFVGTTFSKRRKQLGSILGRDAPLPAGIDARQRPEELTPDQWLELWRNRGGLAGRPFSPS